MQPHLFGKRRLDAVVCVALFKELERNSTIPRIALGCVSLEGVFCALERWRRAEKPGVGEWEVEEKESWAGKESVQKWHAGPLRKR